MSNYDEMRSFVDDVVCRHQQGEFGCTSKATNVAMRLCESVTSLLDDIKELQQREKEATQLLRDVLTDTDALLLATETQRDYITVNMSRTLVEEIKEAAK